MKISPKGEPAALEIVKKYRIWIILLALIVAGVLFVLLMRHMFDKSPAFRGLFSAMGSDTAADGSPEAASALEARSRATALISMYIFAVITVLQFVALAAGIYVVWGIRTCGESAAMKLKQLENAEIFFDIPLYVGLFGTVSAFLVMTFSPQSSRLIAYSSTLIGIVFSLFLRLILQYPLRRRLVREDALSGEGAAK